MHAVININSYTLMHAKYSTINRYKHVLDDRLGVDGALLLKMNKWMKSSIVIGTSQPQLLMESVTCF